MGSNHGKKEEREVMRSIVGGWAPPLPDDERLRKESLKYIALGLWIDRHLTEMPSARLPLKTAYMAYRLWCDTTESPEVTIQAFNRALASRLPQVWPKVEKKRTASGILYLNLTLRAWVASLPAPHTLYPSDTLPEEPQGLPGSHPAVFLRNGWISDCRVVSTARR